MKVLPALLLAGLALWIFNNDADTPLKASHRWGDDPAQAGNFLWRDLEPGGDQQIDCWTCASYVPSYWVVGIEDKWDAVLPAWDFDAVLDCNAQTVLRWEGGGYFCENPDAIACYKGSGNNHAGHFDLTHADILFDGPKYNSYSSGWRIAISAHEWGHNMGLADHKDIGQCAAGTLMGQVAGAAPCYQGPTGSDLESVQCVYGCPPACQDNTYSLESYEWSVRYDWYFNASSTPSGVIVDNAETKLRNATTNITRADNSCEMPDNVSFTAQYQGRISQSVQINTDGTCQENGDGTSVTGFGNLPAGVLTKVCTWFSGGQPVESDVRLNKDDYLWVANMGENCVSKWGVEPVATRGRGRTAGLKLVAEATHGNLTMSQKINGPCQDSESTLGKGDVRGLEQKY